MTIQYKNAGINLSTTDTTTVLTSPSSARCLVKQIQVDNASASPVNLSVQFTDSSSSTTFRIRNKQKITVIFQIFPNNVPNQKHEEET